MYPRELARADGGLLVAPTPEAVHNRFGQQVKVATVWIVAQVIVSMSSVKF